MMLITRKEYNNAVEIRVFGILIYARIGEIVYSAWGIYKRIGLHHALFGIKWSTECSHW